MADKDPRILIVDDMPSNIDILNETLKDDYLISVAVNGEAALEIAGRTKKPDLILLDIMMPGMDGFEVCRKLKENPATRDIPVLFVTTRSEMEDEAKGLALGGVDYITKPIRPAIVKVRVKNHLRLKLNRDYLEEMVRERTKELALTQDVTIQSLASLAETRDNETGGHIMRTQRYVRLMGRHLSRHRNFFSLDDRTAELLFKSAPLHDIGKVGVPDAILLKPGRLTPMEFEEMKKHTVYGRDAIQKAEGLLSGKTISFLRFAGEIAYTHHEKWDGSGYPQGLSGEDIPVSGRLMAVADVYDALVTKRVYKPPFPHKRAVEIMEEGRGSHFDPDVIDAFLELAEEFRKVALELADSREERDAVES